MTGTVIKADAEGFIWLIVGIFWVIAQIAGAAAKKKQPLRRAAGDTEEKASSTDPFAELLRKMAGVEEFRVETPEIIKEAPERKPWKPEEIEQLPDIEPLRNEIMGKREAPPVPIKVPGVDIRPKMSAFRSSVPSIKLPAMNLSFKGSETVIRNVRNPGGILKLSDKSSLRRAMLSHIIFSPPKALEQPGGQ